MIIKPAVAAVHGKIIKLEWCDKNVRLERLPCSACGQKLGKRKWGLAFAEVDGSSRGLRLCEDCTKIAEAELRGDDE